MNKGSCCCNIIILIVKKGKAACLNTKNINRILLIS